MMNKRKKVATWARGLSLALMTAGYSVCGQGVVYVVPNPQPYYSLGYPGTLDVGFDVNGDGTNDFTLRSNDPGIGVNNALLIPLNNSQIVVGGTYGGYVANMTSGDVVGPLLSPSYGWSSSQAPITTLAELLGGGGTGAEDGNFVGQASGYIGFDMLLAGLNYYGWMYVTNPVSAEGIPADAGIYGIVTEFAYETTPNTPITISAVPEPSTWALIGLGSLALWSFSKKRNA
jgi:hypothetical protein